MNTENNAPALQPDPERIELFTNAAAQLIASAGLGAAVLRLQAELEAGPGEHIDTDQYDEWRAELQGALSELRQQILQASSRDEDANPAALAEAGKGAYYGAKDAVDRAATRATVQAIADALAERFRVEDAINPRPPAPPMSRSQRLRRAAGRAVREAGCSAAAFAERIGRMTGRMVQTPLQWVAGVIAGDCRSRGA